MSNGAFASASPPGGGAAPSVTLRTLSPLPRFRIPFPIPTGEQPISAVKLTILAILAGQISPSSSTQAAAAAMTFSERLKQETLQAWRMEMILLELRQNAVIAPETREGEASDEALMGFELADDHECALLEQGDEIVIRIKPPHNLSSLRLPALPKNHIYGLPAGSLTRAGTLSAPPPYSVRKPAEPSSHSSSVAGQPDANFHAHIYRDPARGFRVISMADAAAGAAASRPAAARPRLGPQKSSNGLAGPVPGTYRPPLVASTSQAAAAAAPATRRRNSRSQPPSPALEQRPAFGDGARTPTSMSNTPTFPATATAAAPPHRRHMSAGSGESLQRNNDNSSAPISLNGAGAPAGAAAMPLTALVIGPGVQGRYGSALPQPADAAGAEYGNAAAFAAFTAAGGEAGRPKPKKRASTRAEGDRDARAKVAAEAAERRASTAAAGIGAADAAAAVAGTKDRPKQGRQMSSSSRRVSLPTPPVLPPIRNLAPFPSNDKASTSATPTSTSPVQEKLPAMPSLGTAPTVKPDGTLAYVTSTPEDQLAADAALALAIANGEEEDAAALAAASASRVAAGAQESGSRSAKSQSGSGVASSPLASPALFPAPTAGTPTTEEAPAAPQPKASKADRRYAAIQASLAKERAKQSEAERQRALEAHNYAARKAEEARRKEEEEKQRKVKEQWELWMEVRRREQKAGLPPPAVVSALDEEGKGK